MEKMNQVSVSEFFTKSKEEMYDMAVEMVEKYNRLVDICNDSAERMADLIERHVKKVDELVIERDELIERHKVYTNALNKDIADKAAKIDLLEKEIEGRKEGYIALKVRMDTKYISIDDHNDVCKAYEKKVVELKKESEKWQDLAKMNRDTICDQYNVCEDFKKKIAELEEMTRYWESQYEYVLKCRKEDIEDLEGRLKEEIDLVCSAEERLIELQKENEELENTVKRLNKELADRNVKIRHQKENLDGINKTLEIRTKENESLVKVRNNLNKEIEAHESENARLSEKIMKFNNTITELSHDIDNYKSWNASLHKDIKELKDENSYLKKASENKNDIIRKAYARYVDEACKGREEIMDECYKNLTKDDTGYLGFKQYTLRALEKKEGNEEEAKKFICDSADIIFYNKKAEDKRKEEGTEVKDFDEYHKYNWFPCGRDAIE